MWYSASTNNGCGTVPVPIMDVVLCHAQCGFDLLSWLQVFANLQKFALTKINLFHMPRSKCRCTRSFQKLNIIYDSHNKELFSFIQTVHSDSIRKEWSCSSHRFCALLDISCQCTSELHIPLHISADWKLSSRTACIILHPQLHIVG